MELDAVIRQRRSYRGSYTERPVSREMLTAIVQSGMLAPSGKNRQTPHFVIVDETELTRRLLAAIGNARHLRTAPAAIAVIMTREETGDTMFFGVQDYAASVENMLLTITNLGLGTVWIEGELLDGSGAEIADLIRVPAPHEVKVVLPIGFPAEDGPQREKKPFAERAWFNVYGESGG